MHEDHFKKVSSADIPVSSNKKASYELEGKLKTRED